MGDSVRGLSLAEKEHSPSVPSRLMSNQINIYYSNCAMVAMSPRDIAIYFGRYVQTTVDNGAHQPAELYERHIYMTLEQAQDVVTMLNQSIGAFVKKSGHL